MDIEGEDDINDDDISSESDSASRKKKKPVSKRDAADIAKEKSILQTAKAKHPFLHSIYEEKIKIKFKSRKWEEKK